MIYYIDIDETICNTPKNKYGQNDYENSVPILENIEKVNKLYNEGHTIVYWTSRGQLTGIDCYKLTKKQLRKWKAKHHQFKDNKPFYDVFIDDKAINTKDWK